MFREMRRSKQALSEEECIKVLTEEPRGVLAVHGEDGYPYAFPMDFLYEDGKLYFHCAPAGHKLDALAADNRVSFCVMDKGYQADGEWPLHIRSVIVFGRIAEVEDGDRKLQLLRKLGLKYYPSAQAVEKVLSAVVRVRIMELKIDHMTGKLVKEN